MTAFLDLAWNEKFSSSFGYSGIMNKTLESQLNTSYKAGSYALANLLYHPFMNAMMGIELQWATRQNNDFIGDAFYNLPPAKGNSASDIKLQCSFRYLFSHTVEQR
jgi:hypothetical protein